MTKVNVIGAYGETNFGDDLLMCVFENYFLQEFSNIQLNFVGVKDEYPAKLLKRGSYMHQNFAPDWLVYGGGTQFFSFKNEKALFLKRIIRGLMNPQLILNKIKSKFHVKEKDLDKKIAFLGFGIGPFNDNNKIIEMSKVKVGKAKFVGVRDEVSARYCTEWNIPAVLGADVVFSSYFILPQLQNRSVSVKKKVGIIVRDWDHETAGREYISSIKEFYKNFDDVNFQFIVFAPHKDKKWIKDLKGEDVLIWQPDFYTITQFLSKLNEFDAFISARYHGSIIGALLNKPVICIEIEPKLQILTNQIPEMKLWKKPFHDQQLKNLIKDLNYQVDYKASITKLRVKSDEMLLKFKDHSLNMK